MAGNEVAWKVDIKTIIDRDTISILKIQIKEEVHEYASSELIELLEKSIQKSNDLLIQLKSKLK